MARLTIAGCEPGMFFIVQHTMPDNGGVREYLYLREEGRPVIHGCDVPTARLATLQGYPGSEPRYFWNGLCRDPGESDGRTPVVPHTATHWPKQIEAAIRLAGLNLTGETP